MLLRWRLSAWRVSPGWWLLWGLLRRLLAALRGGWLAALSRVGGSPVLPGCVRGLLGLVTSVRPLVPLGGLFRPTPVGWGNMIS